MGYDNIPYITKERIIMNKYEQQKVKVEQLPDDFKMSDKQTMVLIKDLFEMVKDNNKLIQLNTQRIRILEKKG
jgi:hypothetical protein